MEEVKEEKFGSRKSILKSFLQDSNIDFVSDIWVITCRQAINKDKHSRYLLIIEHKYEERYKKILTHLAKDIPIISVVFHEEEKQMDIHNLRNDKQGRVSFIDFKNRIIQLTKCQEITSAASGSKNATALSRFFREEMGKGFALTDLDFFLPTKKLFLEEKTYIHHNKGYLGIGQCISFREIITDLFPNINLIILCFYEKDIYYADFNEVSCSQKETIKGWGEMVSFKIMKMSKEDLLHLLK